MIVARFAGSAIVCRIIVAFELARMKGTERNPSVDPLELREFESDKVAEVPDRRRGHALCVVSYSPPSSKITYLLRP